MLQTAAAALLPGSRRSLQGSSLGSGLTSSACPLCAVSPAQPPAVTQLTLCRSFTCQEGDRSNFACCTPVLTFCQVACRYIQLPINVQMPEAWQQPWQPVPVPGAPHEMVPLMEAAARQQVGVFGSGPLQEGSLLQGSALLVSTGPLWLCLCFKPGAGGQPAVGSHSCSDGLGGTTALCFCLVQLILGVHYMRSNALCASPLFCCT